MLRSATSSTRALSKIRSSKRSWLCPTPAFKFSFNRTRTRPPRFNVVCDRGMRPGGGIRGRRKATFSSTVGWCSVIGPRGPKAKNSRRYGWLALDSVEEEPAASKSRHRGATLGGSCGLGTAFASGWKWVVGNTE